MNYKELKILEMLDDNKTYGEIQEVLHVSPSKISQIKKKYENSSDNTTTTDTTTKFDEMVENQLKNDTKMEKQELNKNDPELTLEIRKLELEHEREMERMRMEEKERERAYKQKELEAKERIENIKQQSLQNAQNSYMPVLESKLRYEYSEFVKDFLTLNNDEVDRNSLQYNTVLFVKIRNNMEQWCDENNVDRNKFKEWSLIHKINKANNDMIYELSQTNNDEIMMNLDADFLQELNDSIE